MGLSRKRQSLNLRLNRAKYRNKTSGLTFASSAPNYLRHERVRLKWRATGRPDSAASGYCLVGVRTAAIGLVNLMGNPLPR
jgi:hypothetical protein